MPTFQKSLDVYQAYDFKKDVQTPVGFITSLKVGDVTLSADQMCKDPMAPEGELAAFAVLNGCLWDLGVTDAHYFSGQISLENKQRLAVLLKGTHSKVECEYGFIIYDYDPLEKNYYKSLIPTGETSLQGIVQKNAGELNLSVSNDASHLVPKPENYAFEIGIRPPRIEQKVTLATSSFDKVVKPWGEPKA